MNKLFLFAFCAFNVIHSKPEVKKQAFISINQAGITSLYQINETQLKLILCHAPKGDCCHWVYLRYANIARHEWVNFASVQSFRVIHDDQTEVVALRHIGQKTLLRPDWK